MIRPQYELVGFQIAGNTENKAIAIITITVVGREQTFTRELNWSNNHDLTFMQQLDDYIRNTIFVHDDELPTHLEGSE